jgi:hypothetical protein
MNAKQPLAGIRVLTTDPEKRIGLYAIRYLGRAGAKVTGVAPQSGGRTPVGFLSRYLHARVELPKERFQERLTDFVIANAGSYDVLNPIDIAQMLCVIDAGRGHDLRSATLLPPRQSLVVADNKELLTRHAQSVGLRCPRTVFRAEPSDIRDRARSELTFPCIIKFRGDNRETHWRPEERYSIVRDAGSLCSEYRRMHDIEPYPIVQEYIEGKGYGFFALYDRQRILKARFCHKRIREYPAQGGPSSCSESVFDAELDRIGRRLLESLEWQGLAMVEFKFDDVRKEHFIIEVNPRYWGSLPLAVYSGVNFPVLHVLSALERRYEPVLDYRLGRRIRFLDRDILAVLDHVRIEETVRKKMRLLLELFDPTVRDGLISLDDIGPLFGRLFRRRNKPVKSDDSV